MSNSNNFNFANAFLGKQAQGKELDALREMMQHASAIVELLKMPNGDPVNTFAADILRHVRAIEQLVTPEDRSKMIDWQKLVADVRKDVPLENIGAYWDAEKQEYKNPSGGIDWMGSIGKKQSKPEQKANDENPSVGSLFSL